jgi:cell division protein FtsQ
MLGRPRNRRKQSDRSLFRLKGRVNWRRFGLTLASLAGVAAAAGLVLWTLDQPIETVSVSGRFQRVSPADVERAVKQTVQNVGLVSVDLEKVRQAIGTIPWVDAVTVERAWPHGLRIVVTEQVAAARWKESGLLNTRGELFMSEARHVPPELAQLSGPDGTENEVAQRYLSSQGRLTEAGLRLTALRLDARGAWEFDLSNGITVRLGRRDVDDRFERFVTTAAKLVTQRAEDIAYVDMRYANGFAIGWRTMDAKRRDLLSDNEPGAPRLTDPAAPADGGRGDV